MELSLTFIDNGTAHRDVVLRFAGEEWISDSYYFALDSQLLPDDEDQAKVRVVMRRLLEQWLEATASTGIGETAYLPYDFSDQYTGWLRCEGIFSGYRMTRGWSSVEGWSFSPSAVGALLRDLQGFREDGPAIEVRREDMVGAIHESITSLG